MKGLSGSTCFSHDLIKGDPTDRVGKNRIALLIRAESTSWKHLGLIRRHDVSRSAGFFGLYDGLGMPFPQIDRARVQ